MERPGSGSRRKTSFAGMPRRAFRLVEEFTDTAADGRESTVLTDAAAAGDAAVVRCFLRLGADPNPGLFVGPMGRKLWGRVQAGQI